MMGTITSQAHRASRISSGALLLFLAVPLWTLGARIEGQAVTDIEDLGGHFVELANIASSDKRRSRLPEVFSSSLRDADSIGGLTAGLDYINKEYAPLEFHHAELVQWQTPSGIKHKLHVFARDQRNDQWKNFQLDVGRDPASDTRQHRVTGITFVADVSEPVYLPAGDIRQELEWVDQYVSRLVSQEDLFGSLLIAEGDQILFERYFGFEDESRTRAVSDRTRFNMASGGKMLTGVAIAQLVHEGKLDWDTPVASLIEGVPDNISMHHILTHTSGIAEYWTDQNRQKMADATNPQQEFLELVLTAGIDFEPGAASRYSNSNYLLAGHVVAAASGRDYADYIRTEILGPAGMTDTLVSANADFSEKVAIPLQGTPHDWAPVPFSPRPTSAGGAYTTARDMLKFSRALTRGTLLPEPVFSSMVASKIEGVPQASNDFGYGFIMNMMGRTRFIGHGGMANGVNFGFEMVRARGLTLILFSNQNNGAFDDLRKNVMKLISGYR